MIIVKGRKMSIMYQYQATNTGYLCLSFVHIRKMFILVWLG